MLSQLVVRDFRNFSQLDVDVPASGLAIIGDNGHGKTNLLEAVAYLSLLRSLRGARDADVVRFGASVFHIRAELIEHVGFDSVAVGYDRVGKRKRATLDGVDQLRLTAALGALPSVCFSPADVSLVAGGPGERRRFLDVALALSSGAYLQSLQQYRAALLRRNATLRTLQREGGRAQHVGEERVRVWEPALAEHGGVVAAMRHAFVARYAQRFADIAESIGERLPVRMRYVSNSVVLDDSVSVPSSGETGGIRGNASREIASALTSVFDKQRTQELRRGMTLVGPHRDELQLLIGGRELRTFGSAGQQRSAAIALRLLELATLREAIGTTPLLLLDDPFAELDAGRAARVLALLEAAGVGQVLLAVPRIEEIPAAFTRLPRRLMIDGALHEVPDRRGA